VERPGTGGQEPRRKWIGRCIGGRRRESGKQNSQGGWEKWEAGEKGGNYAILHNILLSKKCTDTGGNKNRVGTRIIGPFP